MNEKPQFVGRGVSDNPANRFDQIEIEADAEGYGLADGDSKRCSTQYLLDKTRSIIAYNQSPDIGFDASINPYRGCEHGCVYCYARPTHEYFGLSAGLDFESRIFVKPDAPRLLESELSSNRWKPQTIALSGVTDCYQLVERSLKITRQCLEVLSRFRNPCCIVTKSHLVTRDIDILSRMAEWNGAAVFISLSSLRSELLDRLEPRAARPHKRLQAIQTLHEAGVPVGLLAAPAIPGLNDHELPRVIEAAAMRGARWARYVLLRLPHGLKDIVSEFFEREFPTHKDKIIHRIQSVRGGELNRTAFHERFRGQGEFAQQIESLVSLACKRHGLNQKVLKLNVDSFRRIHERGEQGMLW